MNNKETNKIYVARDLVDTSWYDEGLQSVKDELEILKSVTGLTNLYLITF